MTERVNRTLKQMIAAYVEDNHKTWDQYLPELRLVINSAVQETIGMSPAKLHLGRKLQGPMDKILRISLLMRPLMTLLNIHLSCNQEQKSAAEKKTRKTT